MVDFYDVLGDRLKSARYFHTEQTWIPGFGDITADQRKPPITIQSGFGFLYFVQDADPVLHYCIV
jgi:hypothetical protein